MSVNTVNSDGSLLRVAGGTLYADAPVGTITPFGGSDIPSGYLLCNGQAVSRTNYAELFAVIGTAFGAGDGSTTFNLPDMTGKTTMGVETGHVLGTSEDGALPNIVGRIDYNAAFSNYLEFNGSFTGINVEKDYYKTTGSADGVSRSSIIDFNASSSSNLYTDGQTKVDPANVRVNYIIKAKQSAIPADFMDAVEDAVAEFASVDTVENGNMKAVTSNAVYDYLTPTEISTTGTTVSQGSATIDSIRCIRSGNTVIISGHLSEATLTNEAATTTTITLPNAVPGAVLFAMGAIGYWGSGVDETGYCRINNSRILTFFSNLNNAHISGMYVRFSVTYICQ